MQEPKNRKEVDRWIETWQRAEKALRQVKRRELKAYNYRENLHIIDEMLCWACENAIMRTTTGLVEQQRWFLKLLNRRENAEEHNLSKGEP